MIGWEGGCGGRGKQGDIGSSKRNRVLMSPAPCWGDRCADDVMLKGNRAGRGRGKSRGEESGSTGGQWRTGKAEGEGRSKSGGGSRCGNLLLAPR